MSPLLPEVTYDLSALLFLYREVLGIELPWLDDVVRATRLWHWLLGRPASACYERFVKPVRWLLPAP